MSGAVAIADRIAQAITVVSQLSRLELNRLSARETGTAKAALDVLEGDLIDIRQSMLEVEVHLGTIEKLLVQLDEQEPGRNEITVLLGDNMVETNRQAFPSGTIQVTAKRIDAA